MSKVCAVSYCEYATRNRAKYCGSHQKRFERYGDPEDLVAWAKEILEMYPELAKEKEDAND